jgi:hypothetical protein
MTHSTDSDGDSARAIGSVAIAGVLFTLATPFVAGWNAVPSVAAGATLGVLNLWALARLVRGFLDGTARRPWALIAAVKFGLLFGLVYVLFRAGVNLFALAIGYAALPVGITFTRTRPEPVAPGRGDQNA